MITTLKEFSEALGGRRLILDMDGVLADFMRGALDLHDKHDVSEESIVSYEMHGYCGVSAHAFWQRITSNHITQGGGVRFWRTLPEYAYTRELLNYAQMSKGSMIATSCGTGGAYTHGATEGKLQWLKERFACDLPVFFGRDKSVLARPDAMLVDDLPKNVEAFIGAGGRALLVDRPWNRDRVSLPRVGLAAVFSSDVAQDSSPACAHHNELRDARPATETTNKTEKTENE